MTRPGGTRRLSVSEESGGGGAVSALGESTVASRAPSLAVAPSSSVNICVSGGDFLNPARVQWDEPNANRKIALAALRNFVLKGTL